MTHELRYVESTVRGEKEPTSQNHQKRIAELPLAMLDLLDGYQSLSCGMQSMLYYAVRPRLLSLLLSNGGEVEEGLRSDTDNYLASL
jgi:hypothetical protein